MSKLNDQAGVESKMALQKIGKTRARKEFFPIVDSLCLSKPGIEITDYDKPVAVLLSYQSYVALTAKARVHNGWSKPHGPDLRGTVKINSDLEIASKQIADEFATSLKKSANEL